MPASSSKKPKGNITKAKIVKAVRGVRTKKQFESASLKLNAVRNLQTYSNPTYTDIELEYFEDSWRKSPAGTAVDKKMEFVVGKGIKPAFELLDEKDYTDEQKQKELEQYDEILDDLINLDTKLGFRQRVYDAAIMAKVFGRCVMTWEQNGEGIKLPTAIKLIHPRDTGKVYIEQDDWSILKVDTFNPSASIPPDEMVYFVNRPDSPIRKTLLFGVSEMERIVGAARAYQRIIEYDMPELTTSAWAGYGMFRVKKMGRNSTDTDADLNTLLSSLKPGAFNAVSVDATDDIQFDKIDLEPKFAELVQLAEFYERIMIGNFALPEALVGREEAQTYATLIGKIRLFMEGPVEADREWLSNIISQQWYERNIRAMGKKDILEKVRIKTEFEPIVIEKWQDMIDSVIKLKNLFPTLPESVFLEILKMEQYEQELDASKKVVDDTQQKQVLSAKKKEMDARRFTILAEQYLKKVTQNKTA